MWFDSWSGVASVLAVGSASYVALVLILRISGKRTLSKLNAFDLVVTVALGSTLATIILSTSVSWAEGVAALALLVGLQMVVALAASRAPSVRDLLTAHPTVLARDGVLDTETLRRERIAVAEVRQALRGSGCGDLGQVAAVVLETDGSISVITQDKRGDGWSLVDVRVP